MKRIYILGIGGMRQSAIARHFNGKGFPVSGYDRTPSALTRELEQEGIDIHYEDRPDLMPEVDGTLVIKSPAIPDDLGEMRKVKENHYVAFSGADILGAITIGNPCLAIAGTHGKTTTTAMTAHILKCSGEECCAFIGGIAKNYGSNYIKGCNGTVVVEADEYRRAFLQLCSTVSVVTSTDADHLDVYGNQESVLEAFQSFAARVSGTLVLKKGLPLSCAGIKAHVLTYHETDVEADFHAVDIRPMDKGFLFDLVHPGGVIRDIRTGIPGWVNVSNSIAAAAVALCYGVSPDAVKKGIESFQGVRRRLDVLADLPGAAYVDDFAHHPEELAAAIESIRGMFPGRKLTAVFQPHLYSRTRDFAKEFARVLSGVDKLILLDIYPAREEPLPGVSSELILKDVTCPEKALITKDHLLEYLQKEDLDVLVTFGAGDIGAMCDSIAQLVTKKSKNFSGKR